MSLLRKFILNLKDHGIKQTIKKTKYYLSKQNINIVNSSEYELKFYKSDKDNKSKIGTVTFLIGTIEGESKRYRVHNIAEGLNSKGIDVAIMYDISNNYTEILKTDILVLFRSGYNERVEKIINFANNNNIPTIFDIDDLVFDEEIFEYIDAIKNFDKETLKLYTEGVVSYKKTMLNCDYVTCSTNFLKEYIENKFNKNSKVIRNTINNLQKNVSTECNSLLNRENKIIGYFSGSNTHNKDFLEVKNALLRILNEYENVKLLIVGSLKLDKEFESFSNRIIRKSFMNPEEMIKELSTLYINIAPLEQNSPFTNSKSELKIFESALVNIPTIASNTVPYRECINDGINGLIANNDREWYEKIKLLLDNQNIYLNIKDNLFNIVDKYDINNEIQNVIDIYSEILYINSKKIINSKKLDIAWIIPEPFSGSGGHRNIFRAVRQLKKLGHDLTMYFTTNDIDIERIKNLVNNEFYKMDDIKFFKHKGILESKYDIGIATHWSTVYPLNENKKLFKYLFYFVQDYEPMFAPMGTEYIMAENTYKLGLSHITSGPWPTKILKEKYNAESDFFQFPVDVSVYNTNYKRDKLNKNIVYFSRPEMPRRCFEIGIEALKIVKNALPDVEIILFGSKHINESNLGFKVTNKELLPSVNDLNKLYRNADLGIVFSTTNPSLVPYEMMSSGLAVADIKLDYSLVNYGSEENVFLLDTLPEKMAIQIIDILKNDEKRENIALNGKKYVDMNFYGEEEMGKRIEELIQKKIEKGFL